MMMVDAFDHTLITEETHMMYVTMAMLGGGGGLTRVTGFDDTYNYWQTDIYIHYVVLQEGKYLNHVDELKTISTKLRRHTEDRWRNEELQVLNLRQFLGSSDTSPFGQSYFRLHFNDMGIHVPSSHVNSVVLLHFLPSSGHYRLHTWNWHALILNI